MRRRALLGTLALVLGLAPAVVGVAGEDVVRATLRVREATAVVEATIAPGWHVNAHEPRDEFLIPTVVTLAPPAGMTAGTVAYPTPVERRLPFAGDTPLLLYEGTVRFTAPLAGGLAATTGPLRATLRYQACDDTRCLPPRTVELTATTPGAAPAASRGGGDNRVAGWIERFGWGPTLVLVALLGVALNLTPCVYPLISVTVAFFGGRSRETEGRVLGHAVLYALGICTTFSAMGVTAALTGSLFGAALQQPFVLAAIALVLVALALSNFGLWTLSFPPPMQQRLGRVGAGGAGAFVMGLTMGVVAAPCIGPLVAALLLFVGAQQSPLLGFALFFALGLGMGAPYVALATAAGRLRRLPRGGAWLGWVERVFGFMLLGMAIWFAAPLLPDAAVVVMTAVLLASAGIVLGFLGGPMALPLRWARRIGGVVLVATAFGGLLEAETRAPIAWGVYSEAALARAEAAGRPVLLDFEADWCLPCREMDRTTFRDPGVVRASQAFVALKVDVTTGDEHANAVMERFEVAGVPTYVLLGPDGAERARLVGFVPPGRMTEAMAGAAGGSSAGG